MTGQENNGSCKHGVRYNCCEHYRMENVNLVRKAKLEKALAFDEPRIKWNASFRKGMRHEKDRLASLHEVLIAAVEALEDIRDSLTTEREQRAVVIEKRTREALSKIDKVLGEM